MTTNGMRSLAMVVAAAGLAACGGAGPDGMVPARSTVAVVGPGGGAIRTPHGVTVTFPAGALAAETELRVNEPARHESEPRRIEIEPRDMPLAVPSAVRVRAEDGDAHDDRLVEIEHVNGHEIEHAIESEHEVENEHAREVEVHHTAELELRHARACVPACDAGLECDDGACKPHGGGI